MGPRGNRGSASACTLGAPPARCRRPCPGTGTGSSPRSRRGQGSRRSAWRGIPLLTEAGHPGHRGGARQRARPRTTGGRHPRKTSELHRRAAWRSSPPRSTGLFWQCPRLRDDLWHRRDLTGRLVAIRSGRDAPDPLAVEDLPVWGLLSPSALRDRPRDRPLPRSCRSPGRRRCWRRGAPTTCSRTPSNARALCRSLAPPRAPAGPPRRPTYGEPLPPDVRAACREAWGVPVQDVYSCEELGLLALQCPQHRTTTCNPESVPAWRSSTREGRAAPPGGVGRVVLTSLHNLAMPLIRYAIGDFAEVGAPCPCGRGLPVLARSSGARGTGRPARRARAWPDAAGCGRRSRGCSNIQVVQRRLEDVEVRVARRASLSIQESWRSPPRSRRPSATPFA